MAELGSNQRIAKNSVLLTVRLIITMCISFYTSRVILNALGVEDYGVYNVVGGFVALFTFLTDSLGRALSRYMTVAIAQNDIVQQRNVFSVYVNILVLLIIIVVIICEVIGLWYFGNYVNIPPNRQDTVGCVFQLSILSFIFSLCKTPSISVIIASERTDAYAFFSIFDAFLKLVIVYFLDIFGQDKLIFYTSLVAIASCVNLVCVTCYSYTRFQGFRYSHSIPIQLYKSLLGFTTWNLVGLSAKVVSLQGCVLIINKFCGVVANASVGIVNQLDACTRQFVSNLGVAINPQIVKSYTLEDKNRMRQLIVFASKSYSFIVLIYAIPIAIEADYLLSLWLGFTPVYAVGLLRLTFLNTLFIVMSNPLEVAAHATGDIRKFQLSTSVLLLLTLPLSWVTLRFCDNIYTLYIVLVIMNIVIWVWQFILIMKVIDIKPIYYFTNVFSRILITAILTALISYIISNSLSPSFLRLCIVTLFSIITNILLITMIGFNRNEVKQIFSLLKTFYKR